MSMWEIIILVLAIINIIAFASAIWVSYDEWKRHRTIHLTYPLMGFFFIPLCIVIAFGWPIAKLRKNKKEKARKLQLEKSKEYKLQRFGFRLKGLPFSPSFTEVIYVENKYNERINDLIKRNLNHIQECFDNNLYVQSQFVYLPTLVEQLSFESQQIGYIAPYSEEPQLSDNLNLKDFNLLDYLLVPENRPKIPLCFARYRGEEDGCSVFDCVGFEPDETINEKDFFHALCSAFDHYPMATGPMFQKVPPKKEIGADENFDKESKQLIKEVEERISKLRRLGISQWALEQLVQPELKLSKLVITKDYRILLPDYNNKEIKMEPLAKAVYLLFLKHPEGIMFKCLPDYRKELAGIYNHLRPLGLTEKAFQSIEDVTNPLLNSINEKCARIRGAFIGQFDDYLAHYYYIDGKRGEEKKIALPRNLVVWE